MKKYIFVLAAALALPVMSFSQAAQPAAPVLPPAPAAVKGKAVDPKEAPIPREKFDPTRDPRADLTAAMARASKSGKNIMLDVGGEWCSWCVFMDKFFFQHPELSKIRDTNFVWVKVNYSEQNENKEFLSAYPAATGYPHLYVLDPAGKLLYSKDTSELEMGKGYDIDKFMEFLSKWPPDAGKANDAKSAASVE